MIGLGYTPNATLTECFLAGWGRNLSCQRCPSLLFRLELLTHIALQTGSLSSPSIVRGIDLQSSRLFHHEPLADVLMLRVLALYQNRKTIFGLIEGARADCWLVGKDLLIVLWLLLVLEAAAKLWFVINGTMSERSGFFYLLVLSFQLLRNFCIQ